jgi:hypothetical protein
MIIIWLLSVCHDFPQCNYQYLHCAVSVLGLQLLTWHTSNNELNCKNMIEKIVDTRQESALGMNTKENKQLHVHVSSRELRTEPQYKEITNSVVLVLKRTIPTERPPLVGVVNVNFSG